MAVNWRLIAMSTSRSVLISLERPGDKFALGPHSPRILQWRRREGRVPGHCGCESAPATTGERSRTLTTPHRYNPPMIETNPSTDRARDLMSSWTVIDGHGHTLDLAFFVG